MLTVILLIIGFAVVLPVVFIMGRIEGQSRPSIVLSVRAWNKTTAKWETLYERNARSVYWHMTSDKGNPYRVLSEAPFELGRNTFVAVEWSLTRPLTPDGAM